MPNAFAGIHHLALYTRDLDRTLAFYRDVIGLDVSDIAGSPRGRHAFVHLEPAEHGRPGLHIWEHSGLDAPDLEANQASFNSGPGPMAHLSLYLPDEAAETALRDRLEREGIGIIPFEQLGTFAFWDPNGIMVEIVPPRFDELQRRQSPG